MNADMKKVRDWMIARPFEISIEEITYYYLFQNSWFCER